MVKWTREEGWYPRVAAPSASGANGTPPSSAAIPSANSTRRRGREATPGPAAPRTTSTVPPSTDANADANGTLVEGELRRPRRSVFVADTLRPRAVHHLDARARDVQLQGRTLWLSLHGEAHFRSLRVRDPVTEEEVAALARTRKEAAGTAGGGGGASAGSGAAAAAAAAARNEREACTCCVFGGAKIGVVWSVFFLLRAGVLRDYGWDME